MTHSLVDLILVFSSCLHVNWADDRIFFSNTYLPLVCNSSDTLLSVFTSYFTCIIEMIISHIFLLHVLFLFRWNNFEVLIVEIFRELYWWFWLCNWCCELFKAIKEVLCYLSWTPILVINRHRYWLCVFFWNLNLLWNLFWPLRMLDIFICILLLIKIYRCCCYIWMELHYSSWSLIVWIIWSLYF